MDASSTGWFKLQSNIRIPFMSLYTNWIAGNSNDNVIEIVATKCWIIWKERCMRIFEGKASTSLHTSLVVLRHLIFQTPSLLDVSTELDTGYISDLTTPIQPIVQTHNNCKRWNPPEPNSYKNNIDASRVDENNLAGYGLILRFETGAAIQAGSGTFYASRR